MSRLAKRKSDGAWLRTNAFIRNTDKFGVADREALTGLLVGDNEVVGGLQAYLDIMSAAGVSQDATPADLIAHYVLKGFPREVWYGYSRFDTYADVPGKDYQAPVHAKVIRQGANALRALVTQYLRSIVMLKDLLDVEDIDKGNPGGLVDGLRNN